MTFQMLTGPKRNGITSILLLALALGSFSPGAAAQVGTSAGSSRTATPEDLSTWFSLLLAAQGGGGVGADPQRRASAYAGIKLGAACCTLDLGYDRVAARNGFTGEFSAMLPVLRFPRPQLDPLKNYIRIYAEPGLGRRFGGGLHGYASAKIMIALFSEDRIARFTYSPYIEVQHRFPLTSLGSGDTRVAIGIILPLCTHCGLD